MRTTFLILIVMLFCCKAMIAQRIQRRIYLWDVTWSMKGKAFVDSARTIRTADIYDDVVKALCRYVDDINNESTEILVLPFQEKILPAIGTRKATLEGKEYIKKKIKDFESPPPPHNTNIYTPLSDVIDKYLDQDRNTVVYLLTDGYQDVENERDAWQAIKKWNLNAGENNFLWYVYLTDIAKKDTLVEGAIDIAADDPETPGNVGSTDYISGGRNLNLTPPDNLSFSLKDNKDKAVKSISAGFTLGDENDTPDIDIQVKLAEDNPFFSIDQTVRLQDESITFEIKFKDEYKDYDTISKALSEKTSYKLRLSIANRNKIIEQQKVNVSVNPSTTTLELINKPEKTLRIHVRKSK
jgi:hypothetical protein